MGINFRFAADELDKIRADLSQYEEFRRHATKLLYIGAELRKLAPHVALDVEPTRFKPLPPKSDPNSKIPRPVSPPQGSGPVSLAMPSKADLDAILSRHGMQPNGSFGRVGN